MSTCINQAKENPLLCDVCKDFFNSGSADKYPKILGCGHSFCQLCLKSWMEIKRGNDRKCPSCNKLISYSSIDEVPVNYGLKDASTVFKLASLSLTNSTENQDSYEGICMKHSTPNYYRCSDCKVWICRTCGFFNHKHCNTLPHKEAIEALKDESKCIIGLQEVIETKKEYLNKILPELEKEKTENIIQTLQSFEKTITETKTAKTFDSENKKLMEYLEYSRIDSTMSRPTSDGGLTIEDIEKIRSKDFDFLSSRIVVVDIRELLRRNEIQLNYEIDEKDSTQYAKLVVTSNQRIKIQPVGGTDSLHKEWNFNYIKFERLLQAFDVKDIFPQEVYFQFTFGEIVIKVGDLKASSVLNFLFLTSGFIKTTYAKKHYWSYDARECLVGLNVPIKYLTSGHYNLNESDTSPVISINNEISSSEPSHYKPGTIFWDQKDPKFFKICRHFSLKTINFKIGEVTEGLDIILSLKESFLKDNFINLGWSHTIIDCGFII